MDRTGKSRIGLLLLLVVAVAVVYCGYVIGAAYWREYKLEETVVQRLSFAGQSAENAIRQELMEDIEAMDLPLDLRQVQFVHVDQPRALHVTISYADTVDLLLTKLAIPMSVDVLRPF